MNIFSRVLSASLSPNTEADDVWRAVSMLCMPWQWKQGHAVSNVKKWFAHTFGTSYVYMYNSGRSAFLALLLSFDIGEKDEVIIQAFTCVAVPNSVIWAGARPVYVDIDDTYNIDVTQVEAKITEKTKAIIVQHTFGFPADMDALGSIARKHNLVLIEDLAHALGASYKGKNLGIFGDAAFFSFGRDKALSSVWGGAAILNTKRKMENEKLKQYHAMLPMPGMFWIFQQLFHPIAFALILPLYSLGIGKILLVVLQKCKFLSFPVYSEEKQCHKPHVFPAKYPNALAYLLILQLNKLKRYTRQRNFNAKRYHDTLKKTGTRTEAIRYIAGASYLRYPVGVDRPLAAIETAKKQGILLGNWYHNIIDPVGVDMSKAGYVKGSCPRAEYAASHVVNLPTRITFEDVGRVLRIFPLLLRHEP